MTQSKAKDPYKSSRVLYIFEALVEFLTATLVAGTFLATLTSELGISDAVTGVISSFVTLGCGFQMISVFISRKNGVKKKVIFFAMVSEVLFALIYVAPFIDISYEAKTAIFIICQMAANILLNAGNPLKISWYMSLVDDSKRGIFTSFKQMVSLGGGMAFSLIMGKVIDYYKSIGEIRKGLIISAITLCVLMVIHGLTLILSKEKPTVEEKAEEPIMVRFGSLFKNKKYLLAVVLCVLWNVSQQIITPFLGTHQIEEAGEDVIFRGKNIPTCFAAGNTLVICHEKRTLTGFTAFGGENLKIENFRLINGGGMGIYLYHINNVTVDGYEIKADEETNTVTSNAADGIHTYSISGDFLIKNSVFEGMVDDALNVHSQFYTVESVEGNTIVAKCGGNDTTAVRIFDKGDTIRVYNGSTLEKREDYLVKDIEIIDLDYIRFTLDKPAAAHIKGDAIMNLTGECYLHIDNCRFGKAAVAHLRLQNGGKCLIENCDTACQFCMTGDLSYWFESCPVESLEVRNVKFSRHANIESTPEFFPTEKEPYYHGDVYIHDCTFERDLVFDGRMTKSVKFENVKNTKGKEMIIKAKNCGPVTAEGIKVEEIKEEIKELKFN